jgi:hypothetical protein
MHPVVIMAYDKSPAINKAVAALEEAGMEVRVLNTGTSKLADFLGALADEDPDAEEAPTADEPPAEDDAAQAPKPEPKPEEDEEEPLATESLLLKLAVSVNGERVHLKLIEGAKAVLHASEISIGAKTFYTLNESKFSFWPGAQSNEPIVGAIELKLEGEAPITASVVFSAEPADPPVLEVGRDWLQENTFMAKFLKKD